MRTTTAKAAAVEHQADTRSSDALFRLAFAQSPFALAVHDKDLICLRISDHMARLFNITPEGEEALGVELVLRRG